jgi:hypothetical protein
MLPNALHAWCTAHTLPALLLQAPSASDLHMLQPIKPCWSAQPRKAGKVKPTLIDAHQLDYVENTFFEKPARELAGPAYALWPHSQQAAWQCA